MKMFKKTLCALLTLALSLMCFSTVAFAANTRDTEINLYVNSAYAHGVPARPKTNSSPCYFHFKTSSMSTVLVRVLGGNNTETISSGYGKNCTYRTYARPVASVTCFPGHQYMIHNSVYEEHLKYAALDFKAESGASGPINGCWSPDCQGRYEDAY